MAYLNSRFSDCLCISQINQMNKKTTNSFFSIFDLKRFYDEEHWLYSSRKMVADMELGTMKLPILIWHTEGKWLNFLQMIYSSARSWQIVNHISLTFVKIKLIRADQAISHYLHRRWRYVMVPEPWIKKSFLGEICRFLVISNIVWITCLH